MAKKLEFVSPYSCDECVRHLQALAAQGPFYITKGKGIFRSGDELAMGRVTTSAGPDQVRFQLCGHAYPSPRRKAAWIGINANGALEPQGASTRATMDIEPSPLSKAIGGLVLFVLAALLLIATLLKAYDLEQFIKINIAVLFLFIMIYILYVRTYADCSSQFALLIHMALTAPEEIAESKPSSRPTWLATLEHDGAAVTETKSEEEAVFRLRDRIFLLTLGSLCLGSALLVLTGVLGAKGSAVALVTVLVIFGGLFLWMGVTTPHTSAGSRPKQGPQR